MENSMMINGVKYVREGEGTGEGSEDKFARDSNGLQYVILRCTGAGVHSGYLKEFDALTKTGKLYNSRRLWRWHGRTLSGLAIEGTDDPNQCKFGDVLPEITVTDVCEVIPCSERARISLESVAKWVND